MLNGPNPGDPLGVPFAWFVPLAILLLGWSAWWRECHAEVSRVSSQCQAALAAPLGPHVELALALWTFGLLGSSGAQVTDAYRGGLTLGFCLNLLGLVLAAGAGLGAGLRAWAPSLQPQAREPVARAWIRVAGIQGGVVTYLFLVGGLALFEDDGGRWMMSPAGHWLSWATGAWSAVSRFAGGSLLLAWLAMMTLLRAVDESRPTGRTTSLYLEWALRLAADLCGILIYAGGIVVIAEGPPLVELACGVGLAAALFVDLAVAPFLLWRAVLATSDAEIAAELGLRMAASTAGSVRLGPQTACSSLSHRRGGAHS